MAWKHLPFIMMAMAATLLPIPGVAQTVEDIQKEGAMSREERIKAHRAKIEKIIEDNRKKREAELQAAKDAATGVQPEANAAPLAPGQPVEPGVVTPGAVTPGAVAAAQGPIITAAPPQAQAGRPAPPGQQAPAGPQGARSEARSMVFMYPFDTAVNIGETFVSELAADTKQGVADRVAFSVRYPKDVLNPLAIDHSLLDSIADEEIEFAYDETRGEIYIAANLMKPMNLAGRPLVTVTWEALSSTAGSTVRFAFDNPERTTGVFYNGQNVLGTTPGSRDGVLNSTVMVRNPQRQTTVQEVGVRGLLIASSEVAPGDASMALSLRPSTNGVRAGEEFHVDVVLSNPQKAPLDRLSLYVQFNPQDMELVDSDQGNAIRSGVNMHDGIADESFPFDFHLANQADNQQGTFEYFVGSSTPINSMGVVGRLHFRALRSTPRTDVILVRNDIGYAPTTEVSYLEKSMLANAPRQLAPLSGVAVAVLPGVPANSNGMAVTDAEPARNGRGVSLSASGLRKNRQAF